MRISKLCFTSTFTFILGCSLSLAVYSNYISLQCDAGLTASKRLPAKSLNDSNNSYEYVVLILSTPSNVDKRNAIRETWLQLLPNKHVYYEGAKERWTHYFAVGTLKINQQNLDALKRESEKHNDLLILPQLKDEYASLTLKLLESLKWIHQNNEANLLYVLKCDDDSFVRMDLIIKELHIIRRNGLQTNPQTNEQRYKKYHMPAVGLYWGYFKGNAHVQKKGKWSEKDFFLCDRYLPYAHGGGYALSYDIVEFIARNADYLKLYKSEDVSVGVWTAPLTNVNRLHDKRFDSEWISRGCDDTDLIRHKQTPDDMREMYGTLVKTGNTRLCSKPSFIRGSYDYNWTVVPSQCCRP